MKQNKLTETASQYKKLVNTDSRSWNTQNVVYLAELRTKSRFKTVSKEFWRKYESFFLSYNITHTHAHVLLCLLHQQNDSRRYSHHSIAQFTGLSTKTVGRSLRELSECGIIDYIHGSRSLGVTFFSTIELLVDLPPADALKSFARNKPKNRIQIDSKDYDELFRRITRSILENARQNQNVHLYNNKKYLLKKAANNNYKNMQEKIPFKPTDELVEFLKSKLEAPKDQIMKNLERLQFKLWKEDTDTPENWQKRALGAVKVGIEKGYDIPPWEKSKIQKQEVKEANDNHYKLIKQKRLEELIDDLQMDFTKKGLLTAIAIETDDPEYTQEISDRFRFITFDIAKKRITLDPGSGQYKSVDDRLRRIIYKYFPMITDIRNEI